MRALILIPALILAACGPRVVTKETVKTISVPVVQKCASAKPEPVPALNEQMTEAQWLALSPKQKAETVAAQALRRLGYSDALGAATSAC
ncbi:hypothetical protein [Sphingopyxis sp. C-1]|uniref:hypothetical protein n=1 Tax=Sphingopyxis sp. C-1 TaxID=262667 RepID=UPI0006BF2849|nr:hypothetical protein [Sphingopyxis sp. C-1]GAO78636.1 hypothetical protein SC1_01945 [Sphingopyxis sp. C-1]